MQPSRLCAVLTLIAVPACGGAGPAPSPGPPPPEQAAAGSAAPPSFKPESRAQALASAKVFDERGAASPCPPPGPSCDPLPVSNDFIDRCRLTGFQVRQCGCEARCTGNVAALGRRYDADGRVKECPKARTDCTPPQASAAFQDACNEHGFRLEVCGCEWLCSGDFKR